MYNERTDVVRFLLLLCHYGQWSPLIDRRCSNRNWLVQLSSQIAKVCDLDCFTLWKTSLFQRFECDHLHTGSLWKSMSLCSLLTFLISIENSFWFRFFLKDLQIGLFVLHHLSKFFTNLKMWNREFLWLFQYLMVLNILYICLCFFYSIFMK